MKSNILGEKNKWQKVSDKEVYFKIQMSKGAE
jgi:hypothetical protein